MKKLAILLSLMTAVSAFAEHVKVPFTRKDVRIDIQDARTSTVSIMTTLPVLVNGKPSCTYLGSIAEPPNEDLSCDEVYIYHLVRIADERGKLNCYYDHNRDYSNVVTVIGVNSCPDIVASKSGFRFFDAVNFDEVDDYRMYYLEMEIPKQQIDVSLSTDRRVKKQVLYRRINFPSARAKRNGTIDW